jgi:hypothetical protein
MGPLITRGRLAAALVSLVLAQVAAAADDEPFPRRGPITEAVQKTKASTVCIRVARPSGGIAAPGRIPAQQPFVGATNVVPETAPR